MSGPFSSAKTDPVEYEKMMAECRRRARRDDAIVIGCVLLAVSAVGYGLGYGLCWLFHWVLS